MRKKAVAAIVVLLIGVLAIAVATRDGEDAGSTTEVAGVDPGVDAADASEAGPPGVAPAGDLPEPDAERTEPTAPSAEPEASAGEPSSTADDAPSEPSAQAAPARRDASRPAAARKARVVTEEQWDTPVSFRFEKTGLPDAVGYFSRVANVPIVLLPSMYEGGDPELLTLEGQDMALRDVLDQLCLTYGCRVEEQDGVLCLTRE